MSDITSLLATLPYHVHQIIGACLSYFALFLIVSPTGTAYFASDLFSKLPTRSKLQWHVRVLSFIQASFISICTISVLLARDSSDELTPMERLLAYIPAAGKVQAFAAGYFIWDLFVSVRYLQALGTGSLMHAISAFFITMIGFRPFGNYYGIRFILYALSTPLLNLHWFMDKSGLTGTKWQLVNGICLNLCFFGCRIVWGWYQTMRIYQDIRVFLALDCSIDAHLMDPDYRGRCTRLDQSLALSFLAANTVLSVLNLYWFRLMVKALYRRFHRPLR